MVVNSFNTEFGYELIGTLPYAYSLYERGLLTKTISAKDTKCLYYFSSKHEENNIERSWYNTPKAVRIPNIDIHKPYLCKNEWSVPNLKKHYEQQAIRFKKETVVICNRINREWGKDPINYFDLDVLGRLFDILKDYQVVYINIQGRHELYDNEKPINIDDFEYLKKFDNVLNIHDIHPEYDCTFNELQLRIFAGCEKYITMNGGHSILCSYFGGENIVYSKPGKPQAKELENYNNSFYRWYDQLGDARVLHVPSYNDLVAKVKSMWVDREPICNILIRTANRPNNFRDCVKSIEDQDYENINIFVSYDNDFSFKYIIPYRVYAYRVEFEKKIKPREGYEYGIPFKYNQYINQLHKKVKDGFIIVLDDDDEIVGNGTITRIAKEFKKNKDITVQWRVNIGGRIVPSDSNFAKDIPTCCDVSGIGFAYHNKNKHFANWSEWKRADYRVAKKLSENLEIVKINKVLTKTQGQGNGFGRGEDKPGNSKIIKYKIPKGNIYNYIDKKLERKQTSKKIPGRSYYFRCTNSGSLGYYRWNSVTKKMIETNQIEEI